LLAGFGGLLLLMAAAEVSALLFLTNLRNNDAELQRRFLSRNRILEKIRSQVYLSGTFARDSLLAPEPSGARAQIAALDGLRRETEAALDEYARSLEPTEIAPFRSLRSQIEDYWKVLDKTFSWTPVERDKFRYAFFYEKLIPRRTSMLQIADRVASMNEQELNRGSDQLGALFGRLQLGLVALILTTLIGGATLAGITTVHVLRLDSEARKRFEESIRAQASLEELRAKLVRTQEDERRALSRELHDEIGQSFSAILMEAENLLDLDPSGANRAHLGSIRKLAEKGVDEIRNMALLLRPSMLDDFGLVPALNWQARETAKRTGLRVQVAAGEMVEELPEEHKTCIYRVVQEALTNCARHAQASSVQVSVAGHTGKILVSVHDDGSGFDPQRVRGLGLLGMEERVRHLGGSFDIDSHPGRGTLLKVELPLARLNGKNGNGSDPHPAG
jgi:signal transduction histidine kinase